MNALVHLTTKILSWGPEGANLNVNPKNYPKREELIRLLIDAGYAVTEISSPIPLARSRQLIEGADVIICIDSYLQHLCWAMGKQAIVIFGQSDPVVFGHPENINLLKDRIYLREKQFWLWEQTPRRDDAFVDPLRIMQEVNKLL